MLNSYYVVSVQYAIYVINNYRIIYGCYGCKMTVLCIFIYWVSIRLLQIRE